MLAADVGVQEVYIKNDLFIAINLVRSSEHNALIVNAQLLTFLTLLGARNV